MQGTMRWQENLRRYLQEYETFEPTSVKPPRYFTPYRASVPRWDLAIKAELPELGRVVMAVLSEIIPGKASLAVKDDSWSYEKGRTIVCFPLSELPEVSPRTVLCKGLQLWKDHRILEISTVLNTFAR